MHCIFSIFLCVFNNTFIYCYCYGLVGNLAFNNNNGWINNNSKEQYIFLFIPEKEEAQGSVQCSVLT